MRKRTKDIPTFTRIVYHRILRPRLWKTFVWEELSRLSDKDFLRRFGFAGPNEEFLTQFHSAARFRFFFHPRNQKDFFLQLITSTQDQDQILSEAQDVLQNRFDTLGSGTVALGATINWHKDFKSGKEWPVRELRNDEILDLGNPSDVKVPWELSRFHQVWWLGKAYWLTRNELYARKFGDLVEDWIDKNPLGKGVNWHIAMEAAIRACNWIAGYYFFCESPSLSPAFWLKFIKSLHAHGRFIEYHLEYSWRNGNHFLSDVVGLAFLGMFFQQTADGKQWLQWSHAQLEEQMTEQVYPDGVNYEKSISYHRFVLELFYSATILCMKNNLRFTEKYMNHLEKMFEFVMHYVRPDGSIPLVGDADDGRLLRFSMGEDINDHRHALSVGGILFDRADFKSAAGRFAQDSLWLFGGEGFEKHQMLRGELPQPGPKAFTEGGFYILRSNQVHVFVDAGDLGMLGRGGHGQNDILSFEFWANGEALIVDSGTYGYTFDVQARQEFRSTRAHNTVMVDGKEIAEFDGIWRVKRDTTRPEVKEWTTSPDVDLLDAVHHGYDSPPQPVVHRRRFEFSKSRVRLLITDFLEGSGLHTIESFLHLAPTVRVELKEDRHATVTGKFGRYSISVDTGSFAIIDTRFSKSYGRIEPNKTLLLRLETILPITIRVEIRHEEGTST